MPETGKPRRRVVLLAKIEGDTWDDVKRTFRLLETDIAMQGSLSKSVVSGGYSSGHVVVSSEDESINHDSWVKEIDEYLETLKQ